MTEPLDGSRRWIGLVILCMVAVIQLTGQTLVSVLLQPIKVDLGFSGAMIGLITGIAISVVGGLAAFPIAAAADRCGRRWVLAASIFSWSIAALAMGYSPSATVFSAGVIGFNLGDAAVLPLLYAMVPALFDDERRHRANAILIATLTACAFGVYAIGGLLLDAMTHVSFLGLAPWRAVFVVVTLAGVMIVPLLMLLPGAQPGHKIVGRDATGGSASLDRFLLGMSGSAAAVDDASLFALFQSYTPNKSDAAGARSSSDFSFVTAQAACEVAVARPAKYTSSGVRYCSD